MISYNKLWKIMAERDMNKSTLLEILSPSTIAKISRNSNVNTETIEKICDFLDCQPGDIMENITEKKIEENSQKLAEQMNMLLKYMELSTGKNMEEISKETMENLPSFMEKMQENNFDMNSILQEMINEAKTKALENNKGGNSAS
ncbi:MAG: helix-turn-helix transcriptional regulator [Eubacteriales bacterium]|nr:helix-turn-helix transcriptional regulator [Eubacteriales bacterium]